MTKQVKRIFKKDIKRQHEVKNFQQEATKRQKKTVTRCSVTTKWQKTAKKTRREKSTEMKRQQSDVRRLQWGTNQIQADAHDHKHVKWQQRNPKRSSAATKTVTTSYKLAEHEVHTNIQLFCQKNKSETLCWFVLRNSPHGTLKLQVTTSCNALLVY